MDHVDLYHIYTLPRYGGLQENYDKNGALRFDKDCFNFMSGDCTQKKSTETVPLGALFDCP